MRKGIRKHFFNENYFESIDTEDKAYWLGFIAADGCVTKSSRYNSYRLRINLTSSDEDHLEKFLDCIESNDIAIAVSEGSGFSKDSDKTTSYVTLNSFKLCSDLDKYNIHCKKSYDVELPNISEELIPHYLRGFFDGDASYHYHYDKKSNRYRYSFEVVGASKTMMVQIQKYLLSKNINTNIYTRKSKASDNTVYRLMTNSKKEMVKIIDLLYANSHIHLTRKFNKVNEIKSIAV